MPSNSEIIDRIIQNSNGHSELSPGLEEYYGCFEEDLKKLFVREGVTEIMINGNSGIYIEENGRLAPVPLLVNDIQRQKFIDTVSMLNSRSIDYNHPVFDGKLPDGSRCNIIIPPVSLTGTVITIRRHNCGMAGLDKIVETGMLDRADSDYLKKAVSDRQNIIVAGGTGTGKTTLVNALVNSIECMGEEFRHERIITIEDTAELNIRLPHVISLEARFATADCDSKVTIRDLVKAALRMRPDRIIIGEVRGEEAYDLLHAMNTGHRGVICTLHANSCRDALRRLETLSILGHGNLDISIPRSWIAGNADLVIYIEKEKGKRMVSEIKKVEGIECGNYILSGNIC
ncbi:MAG: CpaF family protein [Oligoflexia bacterium]|nr:CpaF family protein [Oligoflexia bacterium]